MSLALGVGHPVQPLSDVRCAEARSAGIDRPEGVVRSFQVSRHKVEPSEAVLACNLFAKDDARSALRDEAEERGPEVAGIRRTAALPGCGERLTWAAPGPDRAVIRPASKPKGVGPDADASEKMALGELGKIGRFNILDAPGIHGSGGDEPLFHKLPQPRGGKGVDLVVVGGHGPHPIGLKFTESPVRSPSPARPCSYGQASNQTQGLRFSTISCVSR